jgi:hypothetical protein
MVVLSHGDWGVLKISVNGLQITNYDTINNERSHRLSVTMLRGVSKINSVDDSPYHRYAESALSNTSLVESRKSIFGEESPRIQSQNRKGF